jgi:hypothetical protein
VCEGFARRGVHVQGPRLARGWQPLRDSSGRLVHVIPVTTGNRSLVDAVLDRLGEWPGSRELLDGGLQNLHLRLACEGGPSA